MKAEADLVLVEGAGSASEVNLRHYDIANMGFARAADVPVVHHRRHRPRRRDREPGRHQGGARSRGRGDGRGLHHQQVSRRSEPVHRRQGGDRAGDRLAGARASCRIFPRRGICRPRMRWRSITRRRGARARSSRSRCRSCRRSPISTISIRWRRRRNVDLVRVHPGAALPGDVDLVILPGSKTTIAGLNALREGRLRHRHRRACAARRHGAWLVRRLSDAGRGPSPIPTASRGRPGTVPGLGLLDVETVLSAEKQLTNAERHDRATASRSPATRCTWA